MTWEPLVRPDSLEGQPNEGWFDTSRPHSARVYDVWLGGKDGFAADRDAAEQVAQRAPWVVEGARSNRAFLRRAIAYLARRGISQYLDIGAGLPTSGNVHEIANRFRPGSRVVYVDNDPTVLAHARALLARDGNTLAVQGDAREPHGILADPAVRAHLDFAEPVAVLFVAVLHFLRDEDDPPGVVAAFRDAMVPGGQVVISHVADLPDGHQLDGRAEATREAVKVYADLTATLTLRTREQVAGLFAGFELVEPGLVGAHEWRPRRGRPGPPVPVLAGIGTLPHPGEVDGGGGHG